MKTWNVVVHRKAQPGWAVDLGQVHEDNETLARCAALHKYSIADDEDPADIEQLPHGQGPRGILSDEEFSVFPA